MVSFILSCLDRGLICSWMFQGGETRRQQRLWCLLSVVFSLILVLTIHGESSILARRAELRDWIFFRFLWLRRRSGVLILFAIFPAGYKHRERTSNTYGIGYLCYCMGISSQLPAAVLFLESPHVSADLLCAQWEIWQCLGSQELLNHKDF